MLVVEIDGVDTKAPQRGVAGLAHVSRTPLDPLPCPVWPPHVPELRREDYRLPTIANRPAHKFFVGERTVGICRVEKSDAQIECALDSRDHIVIIRPAV